MYRVILLYLLRARQLYRTASLQPSAHLVTTPALRTTFEETFPIPQLIFCISPVTFPGEKAGLRDDHALCQCKSLARFSRNVA